MAHRSPAKHASLPSEVINPHLPGDYPVLLGDAFRESKNKALSLNLQFNWKTHKLSPESRMVVTKTKTGPFSTYNLAIETGLHKDKPYTYTGHIVAPSNSGNDGPESSPVQALALVYDTSKSAFVLEPISDSLDFNLKSAHNQVQREIDAYPKLTKTTSREKAVSPESYSGPEVPQGYSDDQADSNNPYDYRHFLAEARENHAKLLVTGGNRTPVPGSRTPIPGSRTPVLGSRTPLSGMSPVPSAGRFLSAGVSSTTPTFHATSGPSQKKQRKVETPRSHPVKAKTKASRPRKASDPPGAALSKERILDSDDELDDTVLFRTLQDKHPPPAAAAARNHRNQLGAALHGRPSSPHVMVSDADAELEIDMGSPPQTAARRRPAVDPEAFRRRIHATNTPNIADGVGTPQHSGDVEMMMMLEDADVEELELGSPRSGPTSSRHSMHGGRIERMDDDDEDELAAELEAALEEEEEEGEGQGEDESENGAVGLGLGIAGQGARKVEEEEESEVSEEE